MRKDLGTAVPSTCSLTNNGSALLLNNRQKDFDGHKKYPLMVLVQEMDMLPPEINPLKREVSSAKGNAYLFSNLILLHPQVHLTHDDFVSVFKMSFYEFDELPKWKKMELKKQFKLF